LHSVTGVQTCALPICSILIALLVGVLMLREPPTPGRVAGGLAIFAGLVVIALTR